MMMYYKIQEQGKVFSLCVVKEENTVYKTNV